LQGTIAGECLEKKDFLLAGLREGQRFLDIGCGSGELLLAASDLVQETGICRGVDISWEMLSIARAKAEKRQNIHLKQADVTLGLPFSEDSFDLVVSVNLLQEIPAVSFLAEEIYRVTKREGEFRLLIPCLAEENETNKVFSFVGRKRFWYFHTQEELRKILSDNEMLRKNLRMDFCPLQSKGLSKSQTLVEGFSYVIKEFQALGYNPEEVTQGILAVEGKKSFG